MLRMLGKPFETGNFQGTPHVAGQWGSDWQESQWEGAEREKIAAVASEQEKVGVRGPHGKPGDPAAHGEGRGRSHCVVPNKVLSTGKQPRQGLKDWSEMEEGGCKIPLRTHSFIHTCSISLFGRHLRGIQTSRFTFCLLHIVGSLCLSV